MPPTPRHKIRIGRMEVVTRTPRRFIVCGVREEAVVIDGRTYVPFLSVLLRTDNVHTARTARRRYGRPPGGARAVIIDTDDEMKEIQ